MQTMWKFTQKFMMSKFLWWGIIFVGVFLRLFIYIQNRSLWGDEASLALNIVHKNFSELTHLLDYHQAAPIGFLFIEKLLTIIFGNHDYVMRIFPLISGILALYFIYHFARTHLGPAGIIALAMSSFTWFFVYYSSELKQYSSDIMVMSMLVFLSGNCLKKNANVKDFIILGIAGSIAIWVSHPTVFVLVGIGIALLLKKREQTESLPWSWILGIGLGWLLSFGIEYFVSLRHIVDDGYMIEYWKKTYVPSPPWSNKAWYYKTLFYFLESAYTRTDNRMALVTLIFLPIGALYFFIKDKKNAFVVISPFVVVYLASALHLYPLTGRFLLFLMPFTFILLAKGFQGINWILSKWNRVFAAILSGGLAFFVIFQIIPGTYVRVFSTKKVDIRPVYQYISENKEPDDIIYVFPGTGTVFRYYAPLYDLDTDNTIIGDPAPHKHALLESYKKDIASLAGKDRVWYIFTGFADCPNCEPEDTLSYYLNFISEQGLLIDSTGGSTSSGANAFLYDMFP